ncbi:MAG TPA: amino acid adenylation domain-containing protein, partial [Longimicrobiaceae bacterium]
AHHLVVDGVSWRVLVEDLETALDGGALPAKTTPFREWARRLAEHARSGAFDAELAYWTDPARLGAAPLPLDHAGGREANTEATARVVAVELGAEETEALLREVPAAYRTQVNDVLLTALARALSAWTGAPRVLVELEGHGREEHLFEGVDLSRTVGWFTTLFPVLLEAGGEPGAAIKAVKERLRAVPNRGIGHGALRWLGPAGAREALAALPAAEVAFNYLGQVDGGAPEGAALALTLDPAGPALSPGARRAYLLEADALVEGGALRVRWRYSGAAHREETVRALAESFLAELRALVAHCASAGAGGYTPSDFPLAGLDQDALDRLLGSDREVEDVYPLSPMQEGMLFHTLYAPGEGAYVGQFGYAIEGALDADAFERAWRDAVGRHPALRAGSAWQGLERPVQVVRRRVELPFERHDWRGLADGEREARLEAFLRGDRARGFDPARAPLMRLALFRTGDAEHHLVWSFHQMAFDGWSLPLVLGDVVALYGAHSLGAEPALRAVRPYRDYVGWLLAQDAGAAERFWRGALAGFETATPLGIDHAATALPAGEPRHGRRDVLLEAVETAALQGLARREGLTLNTLVQGAWALLLARYSDGDDVVFGATASGRPAGLDGVEEMVGLFINTLPVRVRVPAEARVLPWLRALQERQAETRDFEHAPLAQVQRWSDVPAGEPLFESVLVFENYPVDEALGRGGSGLRVAPRETLEQGNFPLALAVVPGERIALRVAHDRARIDDPAVERLAGHLRALLLAMASAPLRRLDGLSPLSAAERERMLAGWSATAGDPPALPPVHRAVAAWAARTPQATALACGEERVGYAALERRASRLARHLRGLGAGPEGRVGVCLERGVGSVVALLAVWKAGAAYVPLDPAYPAERLRYLLEDSGVSVLVTQGSLRGLLPEEGLRVACLDGDAEAIAAGEATDPGVAVGPESLAYVIYTSGSTGRPKGVRVEHGSLAAMLSATLETMELGEDEEVPALASFSFDISLLELLSALLVGGVTRIMPAERVTEVPALLRELAGVTTLHAVPALMRQVAEEARRGAALPRLRRVLVGGDRVPADLLAEMRAAFPGAAVHVTYGPTEGTILASAHRVPDGVVEGHPIGRPMGHVRLYVCDRRGEPVPVGVPGELRIGGAGVARDYLGRPDLSADRFVPDAFGGVGARLYRTGDRVRWLEDGTLEFMGRTDAQVKIRGFRIEPGEVEAAVRTHAAVREAVVVVREDAPGERRLVAYVVAAEGAEAPAAAALRAHLGATLPEYMVPSAWVALDALPLTPTGKVDRRALPAPEAPAERYVAPRDGVEAVLAEVWAAVLRRERVGVEENFFEAGGDSILSIQVVSRARQRGVVVTPRQLFEHPTVAELARVAGTEREREAEQGAVTGEVPLTPVQAAFFAQDVPRRAHWNLPLLLEVRTPLEPRVLERALARLAAHHDALRTRFEERGGVWRQEVAAPGDAVPVTRVDLSGAPEAEHAAAVERAADAAQRGLDLARGPLLRAVHFRGGAGRGDRLLLVAHHLVVDGVSWRILAEDLQTLVEQEERGAPPSLPAKTTSFRSWAHRLAEHVRSGGFDAELPFWTGAAHGAAAALPVDFEAGEDAGTEASARAVSVWLDEAETAALLQEAPAAYRTQVNDLLLAALARTLAEWTGSPAVLVEMEGHGREELFEDVDLSRTVGWFTTLFPVRLEAGGDPGAAIKAVKERLRAVPGRGIGHGALRWLGSDAARAALAAVPRAQVRFEYMGRLDAGQAPDARFALSGDPAGAAVDPGARRSHLLVVGGSVREGRMELSVGYSERLHRRDTVERLAESFRAELRALAAHCASPEAGGYTPGDFPMAGLDQAALDRLLGSGRGVEDVYPLTPMQEGMLFHTLYAPEGGAYVAQFSFDLVGDLEVDAFRRAWQGAADRHPVLRTGFVWEGVDRPLQVVRRRA